MPTRDIHCATCGIVARFVPPPCPDSHGGDCPEWMCTRCGEALLTDPPSERVNRPNRRPERTARTARATWTARTAA